MVRMAKSAVVFSGRNGLDFHELRSNVLRIPDVTLRIREAQARLDEMDLPRVDLLNYVGSEDEVFFRNLNLKSLLAAIVQVGLYDRFLKSQKRPDYLVGNSNGDSALMVCAGKMSFKEMIETSPALGTLRPVDNKVLSIGLEPAPLLSGISLTEYQAFAAQDSANEKAEYEAVREGLMELKQIVSSLHRDYEVTRFVNVGPASALRSSDYKTLGSDETEALDSIELDPMLSWFWRNMRLQDVVLAQ